MRRAIGALTASVALLGTTSTAEAAMDLPAYEFTVRPEKMGGTAPYECFPNMRKGTKAFGELVKRASGYGFTGWRACSSPPTSHHQSGRAIDFFIDHREEVDQDDGMTLLAWLFRDNAEHLKRLGVSEILWGGKIWTVAVDGRQGNITPKLRQWRQHRTCTPDSNPTECHYDHIHFSLSRAGSMKETTFWTARA